MRFGILAILVLGLTGCAHGILSKAPVTDPCASIDWWETGRSDGASGLTPEKIDTQEKKCAALSKDPDRAAVYANGFEEGLVDFCTVSEGVEAGRNGQAYEHICPANLESGFLTGFEKGKRISQLEKENKELEQLINNNSRSISSGSPAQQIEQLRKRRAQNETEIQGLENSSD